MFRILISTLVLFSSAAFAGSLKGLPPEIQDYAGYYEGDALDAITSKFMCKLDVTEGDFKLLSTEKQEQQYAQYPGELSSFTIQVTTDLGGHGCEDRYDKVTCKFKFDLYDENAYRLDGRSSECD